MERKKGRCKEFREKLVLMERQGTSFIFRNGILLNVVFMRMDCLTWLLCNDVKVGAMSEFVGLIFIVVKHSLA